MHRRDLLVSATLIPAATLAATAQQSQTQPAPAAPPKALPQPAKGVKITVVKRSVLTEFQKYRENNEEIPACRRFQDGQEFFVGFPWVSAPPKEFCGWAWNDIVKSAYTVHGGQINRMVTCCTDGFRPVFFLLERVV